MIYIPLLCFVALFNAAWRVSDWSRFARHNIMSGDVIEIEDKRTSVRIMRVRTDTIAVR